jgi:hypothetical protein
MLEFDFGKRVVGHRREGRNLMGRSTVSISSDLRDKDAMHHARNGLIVTAAAIYPTLTCRLQSWYSKGTLGVFLKSLELMTTACNTAKRCAGLATQSLVP